MHRRMPEMSVHMLHRRPVRRRNPPGAGSAGSARALRSAWARCEARGVAVPLPSHELTKVLGRDAASAHNRRHEFQAELGAGRRAVRSVRRCAVRLRALVSASAILRPCLHAGGDGAGVKPLGTRRGSDPQPALRMSPPRAIALSPHNGPAVKNPTAACPCPRRPPPEPPPPPPAGRRRGT